MLLIQLAIAMAMVLLMVTGTMATAGSQMAAIRSAQALQFYSQDVPLINLTLQKVVGNATSFHIFSTQAAAEGNLLGSVVTTGGAAIRLTYSSPRPDAVLYFNAITHAVIYENAPFGPDAISWTLASPINTATFAVADTATATAAGLIVATMTWIPPAPSTALGRQVTFYAERF